MVWATEPETNQSGARQITAVLPHPDTIFDLRFDHGTVSTTEDHRFWNQTDQEWGQAQHLGHGDTVLTTGTSPLTVTGIDWNTSQDTIAYDITVDQLATFYIGIGEHNALVHNSDCQELISSNGLVGFLDAYAPGGGFTGAFDPESGVFIIRPSGSTKLADGTIPPNLVPQGGGHLSVSADLATYNGTIEHHGFVILDRGSGAVSLGCKSGGLNGEFPDQLLPPELRQPIVDAVEESTGLSVAGFVD